jgi:hypothetical protein
MTLSPERLAQIKADQEAANKAGIVDIPSDVILASVDRARREQHAGPKSPETSSDNNASNTHNWPNPLANEAYHGLAGEIARVIEPHSESDPAAILIQLLTAFGSAIGREPYYLIEGDKHTTNIFVLLVGATAKGRKGTAWGRTRQVFEMIDDHWVRERVVKGLASGEGLIWAVRDPIIRRERNAGGEYEDKEIDPGIDDKRLLVIESEFASLLRAMERDGNTLSPLIRQAWDSGDLCSLTKNNQARASGALISIIGHVTSNELRRYLNRTETGNGFANRFLFVCVRRSKFLPEGGQLNTQDLQPYAERMASALGFARSITRVEKDAQARAMWARVYPKLAEGVPGLLGAVISRAEAQVIRLGMLYALLDQSTTIGVPQLEAALALWEYAEASAKHIFGAALGDPLADDILRALRAAKPHGLTRTEISALFKRHKDARSIGQALELLVREGLVDCRISQTEGRPAETWFAT